MQISSGSSKVVISETISLFFSGWIGSNGKNLIWKKHLFDDKLFTLYGSELSRLKRRYFKWNGLLKNGTYLGKILSKRIWLIFLYIILGFGYS